MRTPMSSLLGVAQMLLDTHLTEAQKEFVDTAADSVNALTGIADTIAEFSRQLAAQDASSHPHHGELNARLNGNGSGSRHGNGNVAASIGCYADTLNRRADDMLAKGTSSGNRRSLSSAVANFTTRVPAETAKLIRILVAEDHVTNRQVMLRMLARLGFTADAVGNGVEAVAAITHSPYDIVLMDCQMPELDGYEATRQIRRAGGRFKSTPIIAVTANAMAGDREKCLASGMSDYMSKPVLAQTLATTLERWILPDAAVGAVIPPQSPPTASSSIGTATQAEPNALAPTQVQASARSPIEAAAKTPSEPPASVVETSPALEPAVDPAALEMLRSMDAGDEGFLGKIIELFLSDLTERIDALKAAARGRDGDGLKRVAHALKGSCGHFGANQLAALCRKIEQIGVNHPVADASETIRELEVEASRVRVALEQAKADPGVN